MKTIKIPLCLFISFLSIHAFGQTKITAKEAAKHLNEKVMVCDQIYGGKFLSGSDITLIDVGGSHPNEVLTLVIKGDDRKKFKTPPEEAFKGKKVCITGQVIDYKGKPEIMITEADQIKEDTN
jgi:DNA/RNA endonuclease YhcR with UshA esterase domain